MMVHLEFYYFKIPTIYFSLWDSNYSITKGEGYFD